jgi:hypothetical protein
MHSGEHCILTGEKLMNKTQKIALSIIFAFAVIVGIGLIKNYRSQTVYIPKEPVAVLITKDKNQDAAVMEAVTFAGEAMEKQCQWTEEKVEADYYLPYANIDVKVYEGYVTAQAVADKSVCPEK